MPNQEQIAKICKFAAHILLAIGSGVSGDAATFCNVAGHILLAIANSLG